MIEQIFEIIKEAFSNKYFIPIILLAIIAIIIKNKIDYKEYLKTCKIFNQKPKKSGYIKNSIIEIIGIITISITAFIGYEGLNNSQRFIEKYENKNLKPIIKKEDEKTMIKILKDKKSDIKYSIGGKVVNKEEFLNNTVVKEKKPYENEHQSAKENLLKQMKN
ncbi:hypothetical protein [Sulfurovum sp.]|uniref:hypothetical protein n=1 Tax=Sulfurovum sp. TaxID=1969726 RepID=UPI002867B2B9|nr:hypothetical protein [Sulfurovum sp.]